MVTAEQKEELKRQRQAAAEEKKAIQRLREAAALRVQCAARRRLAKLKVSARRIELVENGEMAKVILAQRRLVWEGERRAVRKPGYPGSLIPRAAAERERNKFRQRALASRLALTSVQGRPADFFLSSFRAPYVKERQLDADSSFTASGATTPSLSDPRDPSPQVIHAV